MTAYQYRLYLWSEGIEVAAGDSDGPDELIENPQLGFEKAYEATSIVAGRAPITTEVYRFPQTYGGVAAITP